MCACQIPLDSRFCCENELFRETGRASCVRHASLAFVTSHMVDCVSAIRKEVWNKRGAGWGGGNDRITKYNDCTGICYSGIPAEIYY